MGALMGGGPGGLGMMLGGKGQKGRKAGGPKAQPKARRQREPEEEPEGDPESGYFGIAITRDQRIRKNMDKLYRLVSKFEELAAEIEETEDKLASFGVDVEELYASWDYTEDPGEAYGGVMDDGADGYGGDFEGDVGTHEYEGGSEDAGGEVIGHIDDLSDEEIAALEAGELTLGDIMGEAAVAPLMDFDEDEAFDEGDEGEPSFSVPPEKLFPIGTTSGRGFKDIQPVNSAPWIALAKYTTTSKQGIASPIGAFAAEARRSLLNNASRSTDDPVWVYQQNVGKGTKAIMYYVAVGEEVPPELIQKWNSLPGYGKVKLIGTANGAGAAGAHTIGPRGSRLV